MKRKKFIKRLMGLGISRITAVAVADAASRAEIPLIKVAGRIQTMQRIVWREISWSKEWRQAFDWSLLDQAKRIQPRVRRLTTSNTDGLVAHWLAVDEVHLWPKENPHLGGGGHE